MKRRVIEAIVAIWAVAILAGMLICGELALHLTDTLGKLLAGLPVGK